MKSIKSKVKASKAIAEYKTPKLCWIFTTLLLLHFAAGCKKFIEIEAPYTSISAQNVYSNDVNAASVLTGLYADMSQGNSGGLDNPGKLTNMVLPTGLSGDELVFFNLGSDDFYANCYRNTLSQVFPFYPEYWSIIYSYIHKINVAINALTDNSMVTASVQKQLLGEAKFLRAFCFFHLTHLYGDVPLTLSTDYQKNAIMPRTAALQVYDQVVADLTEAQQLLSEHYLAADLKTVTGERVRPTKWAATALLARVYLYQKRWSDAETQADALITNLTLFDTVALNNVFLKNNKEAIWQLQPVFNGANTGEAHTFNLTSAGPDVFYYRFYLSDYIYNAFEPGDQRKAEWTEEVTVSGVTYPYSYKYKVGRENTANLVNEYLVLFRLAEQYLIRAEARTYMEDFAGAKDDLNVIRRRAGLGNTTAASTQEALLEAILQERKVELFTEGGHRWFDLKRWPNNKISDIMTPICKAKGGSWNNNWALYPIPIEDLQTNQALVQNPGY